MHNAMLLLLSLLLHAYVPSSSQEHLSPTMPKFPTLESNSKHLSFFKSHSLLHQILLKRSPPNHIICSINEMKPINLSFLAHFCMPFRIDANQLLQSPLCMCRSFPCTSGLTKQPFTTENKNTAQ